MKTSYKAKLKRALFRLYLFTVMGLFIPLVLIGNCLIIHFTFHDYLRLLSVLSYSLGSVILLFFHKRFKKALFAFSLVSALLLLWFICIPASNDRNWDPAVAQLPKITYDENLIHIEKFRHFEYTPNETKEKYRSQTFDIDQLVGTDLIISYWDNYRTIGHTFVSFRFKDGQNIAISLEVRKQELESYDPLRGMFKQYELIYLIGDERDLIPLRTKIRHEETFLYPMNLSVAHSKSFLKDILEAANKLNEKPQFYNSISRNCTTGMIEHLNKIRDFQIPLSQKIVLNGILDYYSYQLKGIPTDLPFDVLKRACYISETANQIPLDENFSLNLRQVINTRLEKERRKRNIHHPVETHSSN
ncbi:DUF4105 domain-containing protein [Lentisphaera profundi]|uniref:DUF4105 domain-containing protein n=1 Tax=Lentisphaera profundi TaxID=1658616 RepID=A0ABY7VYM9_9BACT|nr:DUF4105 domain-containing protein [Lentisphaera profundi]WDE99212.1 DUF4105 domain-containing protein [Lentisphaera profundi]